MLALLNVVELCDSHTHPCFCYPPQEKIHRAPGGWRLTLLLLLRLELLLLLCHWRLAYHHARCSSVSLAKGLPGTDASGVRPVVYWGCAAVCGHQAVAICKVGALHDQTACCITGVPIFTDPTKQNCLALLAVVSVLWCTEALPLYVTSMLVPFLAVLLRVMVDRSGKAPRRMSAPDAADAILKSMFSQVWYRVPPFRWHRHTELPPNLHAWLQESYQSVLTSVRKVLVCGCVQSHL